MLPKKPINSCKILGVSIWKNVRVTGYDGKIVTTNSDLIFDSATVIWTAGVQGALPNGLKADSFVTRINRIKVNQFNQSGRI